MESRTICKLAFVAGANWKGGGERKLRHPPHLPPFFFPSFPHPYLRLLHRLYACWITNCRRTRHIFWKFGSMFFIWEFFCQLRGKTSKSFQGVLRGAKQGNIATDRISTAPNLSMSSQCHIRSRSQSRLFFYSILKNFLHWISQCNQIDQAVTSEQWKSRVRNSDVQSRKTQIKEINQSYYNYRVTLLFFKIVRLKNSASQSELFR